MFFGFDLSDFCSGGWFVLAGKKGEWGQFKIPAIPWFRLNFLLFYCPGGRTHGSFAAKGFSPSAPPFSSFGYGEKL